MAYFECISGGAGGGATITVTYDSSFYNKTITCSNGSKTYTKTTTSSGSTEFSVSDEGTWTITCNGVSRTVYVVLNYYTQMAITKTITVYSAANDTISFTDSAGSKTVTTNASGQGSVNITFIPPSQNITFISSVAKNPNNLSQNYTRNINLTESTTSIWVMPYGALYWYGWRTSSFTLTPSLTETSNTNSVKFTSTRESTYAYFTSDVTNFSKLRCITVQSTYIYNSLILHSSATELNTNGRWPQNTGESPKVNASIFMNNSTTPGTVSTLTPVTLDISSYTGNKCVGLGMYYSNFYSEINALWLE